MREGAGGVEAGFGRDGVWTGEDDARSLEGEGVSYYEEAEFKREGGEEGEFL